ncbi:MAG: hypothetical protein HYY18_03925 [Planctomycetes bacterium]|nr:hypothetical protein [Planctomycetota bacterium]
MGLLIKLKSGRPPEKLLLEDFEALVRRGRVPPDTPVSHPALTRGEWWTAADLEPFHRASPNQFPPGAHLAAIRLEKVAEQEVIRAFHRETVRYSKGRLIEERLGLESTSAIALHAGVKIAARLQILESFEPERVLTLIWDSESPRICLTRSQDSIWDSLPHPEWRRDTKGRPKARSCPAPSFRQEGVSHQWIPASSSLLEFHLGTADQLLKRAIRTGTSSAGCIDGTTYRHLMSSGTNEIDATWENPVLDARKGPLEFLTSYAALLSALNEDPRFLGDLVPP